MKIGSMEIGEEFEGDSVLVDIPGNDGFSVWHYLTREEVEQLRDHLTKVLDNREVK